MVKNFWIKSSHWTSEVINKTLKMCIIFTIKNTKIKENILKAYIEKNKWIELVMCKEKGKKEKKMALDFQQKHWNPENKT